jgi:hypothetical protein
MKRISILLGSIVLAPLTASGQSKTYTTSGVEVIFSFADIEQGGVSQSSTMRFAPVFNLSSMLNRDVTDRFGLFTGLAVRNVGYIFDNYEDFAENATYKKKFRSYNLGVPVGFKIGDLDRMFIYAGYEAEIAFLYKEKTFEGGDKIDKITGWFSDRQDIFQHGFLVGIQFPKGANLKFKYYLSDFHNQDFVDGSGNKPYEGLNSQVFYFSLNMMLFKNVEFYMYD